MVLRCFSCLHSQDQVDAAVKQLLALKAEYKKETGQDYKPGMAPTPAAQAPAAKAPAAQAPVAQAPGGTEAAGLYEQVAQQGETLRKLKSEKAPKVSLKNNSLWHAFYD